ncbi:MAG: alpha-amylase family glycosyl hydrolase [Candidatus Melainabacteria bacterium]|nr:alpha-amylase family glycosyl hydrolase [Candidatus Melainabacteria bacterium]
MTALSTPTLNVTLTYYSGLAHPHFQNVRLVGSWNDAGQYSTVWRTVAMEEIRGEDGCPAFRATVSFPASAKGTLFRWGVLLDAPGGSNQWGIPTEVNDRNSTDRSRSFVLNADGQQEAYYFCSARYLGANKRLVKPNADENSEAGMTFRVWAPNAQAVEVVFGNPDSGYIADIPPEQQTDPKATGAGQVSPTGAFPMQRAADGTWWVDETLCAELASFTHYRHKPYMYRLTKDNGHIAYRTDLYSRCQIGHGKTDPAGQPYTGSRAELDGTKSCSVVVDPDQVTQYFEEPTWPEQHWLKATDFWKDEFSPQRPMPTRIEDLVIYELHVGGLGASRKDANGNPAPGTLEDAINMLDYLVDLGVNAIELMPMAEYEGWASWGYGSSHYYAIEYACGGRDQFKHFVKACHQHGIAVILDVVYNHYHHFAERAEWQFDSDAPERNIYYWYQGQASDYPNANPPGSGGYLDNMSTGYAPRFWEERVRDLFISSALVLADEFHVDGFRVDQTTSIHSYPVLHANGNPVEDAKLFGAKFLREWTRSMKLLKPGLFLIAEDHSGWDAVTKPTDEGGLGFDAVWYADFYHHLMGDTDKGPDYAKLIHTAALANNEPLAINYFAGALQATNPQHVVYSESHDEAGNSQFSARTIMVAVNHAPLVGDTRRYAEARSRFAVGMSLLSAGVPMFFMGEEVGASQDYRYNDFLYHREDFEAMREHEGQALFRFYQDLIRLRRSQPALQQGDLTLVEVDNVSRVLGFLRQAENQQFLVLASLNNQPFANGYWVSLPPTNRGSAQAWKEIFNSDSSLYGGNNVGNASASLLAENNRIGPVVPANGFVVLQQETG